MLNFTLKSSLKGLGVDSEHAYAWSRTRKGGWAVAQSPMLTSTITLERLRKRGYVSLSSIYRSSNPSVYEPLSTQLKLDD